MASLDLPILFIVSTLKVSYRLISGTVCKLAETSSSISDGSVSTTSLNFVFLNNFCYCNCNSFLYWNDCKVMSGSLERPP